MAVQDPTPEAARSALAEANARNAVVRASDRLFQPALLVLAGMWIAGSILIAVMPSSGAPAWVGPLEGVAVVLFLTVGIVAFALVKGRQRAYSRTGNIVFSVSILAWLVWTVAERSLSYGAGWVAPGDPMRAEHFVFNAVISVAPLLVGALVVGRRR